MFRLERTGVIKGPARTSTLKCLTLGRTSLLIHQSIHFTWHAAKRYSSQGKCGKCHRAIRSIYAILHTNNDLYRWMRPSFQEHCPVNYLRQQHCDLCCTPRPLPIVTCDLTKNTRYTDSRYVLLNAVRWGTSNLAIRKIADSIPDSRGPLSPFLIFPLRKNLRE